MIPKCATCGLSHTGDCLEALVLEVARLRGIIETANNILFDACRHADDVEHTIECHTDTVNYHFRAVAKGVNAAMEVVGAEVFDQVGG